jgi:GAF domain-containing protein
VSENSSLPAGSALSELAGLLLSTESFEDLVQGVAELAVRAISSATTCGITLAQDGRVITVGSADALATQLDEQQYEHHTGPCLEALKTGEVVEAVDLAEEARWGVYPAIAMSHGIRSVLSTPLIVNRQSVGVLNLYARDAHAFHDLDHTLAQLLAGQATIAVTAALRHYDELTLSDHLRAALSSRSVIDQAIGILMAQQRCDAEQAFALLRAVSQQRNIKLREVAANLVAAVQSGS